MNMLVVEKQLCLKLQHIQKQRCCLDFVRFNVHLHEFCFTHLVHKVSFYTKHIPHVKKDKKVKMLHILYGRITSSDTYNEFMFTRTRTMIFLYKHEDILYT